MKIKAPKQIVESILINLQPFLEKKDASQITSHILFKTEENRCIVKATDNEIGLHIVSDRFDIESQGAFTANGKKLLDIIRILKDDDIVFELQDETLIVKQKHSKFKLPTFDPETFPSFPDTEGKPEISLDAFALIQNLKKISPAIDTNNPKYELNGALINIKREKTDLVGTDTRRLAVATIEGNNENELALIVPKKAIMEIQKLFLDRIRMHYDETNLIVSDDNYYFYTRLINGKYPDYERIIPASVKHTLTLPKKEMVEAIKMITTISNEIKMTLLSHSILFNSLSADNIEAKTEIEIDTGLEEKTEISFNSRYILDFITQTDHSQFTLGFNESTLPFIVKDDNFITIIMPIVA